jgi:DNA repair protein RadC
LALHCLADAVIIAHNHPSGNIKPSTQDEALTRKIKEALVLIDVKLLDHFVLTQDAYFSFEEEGWL